MDLEEESEITIMIIADVEGELDFKGTKIKTLAVTKFCVKSYEMTGHLNIHIFFVLFCCINLVILFFLTTSESVLGAVWKIHRQLPPPKYSELERIVCVFHTYMKEKRAWIRNAEVLISYWSSTLVGLSLKEKNPLLIG